MRRLLGLLFAALIWVNAVEAQELNCTVEVNSQQIEGTNKNVFDALQEGISTYMNETKFSNAVFSPNEKIECRLFLTVAEYSDDRIKGELQLQLSRPVYNIHHDAFQLPGYQSRIRLQGGRPLDLQ